jgi:putative toxin-antitoxin system antitoxin component (TIGR02293 family)
MAVTGLREKCVMAVLLAETAAGIKRLLRVSVKEGAIARCAICAYILGQMPQGKAMARSTRKSNSTEDAAPDSWEQADTPRGSFQEIEHITGRRFPLPYTSIDELKERGFTNDELYAIVAPRRTLARRKENGEDLTVGESDRVLRIQHISGMAERIFGEHEKAHRWLRKRSRVLNEVPLVLLQSETGARLVEEELHRIDYGIYV